MTKEQVYGRCLSSGDGIVKHEVRLTVINIGIELI